MARLFAFFTLFHLSLTFFRPEVPFNVYCPSSRLAKGVSRYGVTFLQARICVSFLGAFSCLNINPQDLNLELANHWAQIIISLFSKKVKYIMNQYLNKSFANTGM